MAASLRQAFGRCVLLLCALATVYGCSERRGMMPQSGGRPYEVLVVGDREQTVERVLTTDVEGLPQRELAFDVSKTDHAHFDAALRLARNIVIVDVDSARYASVRVRYEKDVYAEPQMVIYIGAPSVLSLKRGVAQQSGTLRTLLGRAEINAAIARMEHQRNYKAEAMVSKMFGVSMWIPMELSAFKKGKDFLWMSNNAPDGMLNMVVYKLNGGFDATRYTALRDSVMGTNIKGETDAMQMTTVPSSVKMSAIQDKGRRFVVCRGLWEMSGDAMGGPFVSRTIGNVTVETFVYAPGKKKRNKLRQLEAALYTLK